MYTTNIRESAKKLGTWSKFSMRIAKYGILLALVVTIIPIYFSGFSLFAFLSGLCFIFLALVIYLSSRQMVQNMSAVAWCRLSNPLEADRFNFKLDGPFRGISWFSYFGNVTTAILVIFISGYSEMSIGPIPVIGSVTAIFWFYIFWRKYKIFTQSVFSLQEYLKSLPPEKIPDRYLDLYFRAKEGDVATLINHRDLLSSWK